MNLDILHKAVYPIGRITPQGAKLLGTCFALNKPGLFATSLHVTDQNDTGLAMFVWDTEGINSYQFPINEFRFANVKIIAADPISDLCIIQVPGDQRLDVKITGSDQCKVLDSVNVVGYPHATDGRNILTIQKAHIGAKIKMPVAGLPVKHLVLNMQTRPGQSGSPVFNDDSTLIGVISGAYTSPASGIIIDGLNPGAINQTTYAVSSEYLLPML